MATVLGVPRHGVSERGEVDPDLVGAASVEVTAQKRMGSLSLDDLVTGPREAAARDYGHPLALLRVTADRPFELSRVVLHAALHDREVRPAERAVLELGRQRPVALVIARDHDQPGRALVEPVDHARARRSTDRGPLSTSAEQGVHQRPRVMPRRGVNHHPRRLVDDDEVGVLVDDFERDLLCCGLEDESLGDLEVDDVPGSYGVGGRGGMTVELDEVAFDQPGGGRPAQVSDCGGEEAIQPRRGLTGDQALGLRRRK